MRYIAIATALVITAAAAGRAHAGGPEGYMVVDSSVLLPQDDVADSVGYGFELRMVDRRSPLTMAVGGFAAIGQADGKKAMRDVYDLHYNVGVKPERTRGKMLIPYLSVGMNFLGVTTREPAGQTYRGTTIGLNAQAGVMGHLGDKWLYRASATYLGAIVPGTGDDLGGVVLSIGVGRRLFE